MLIFGPGQKYEQEQMVLSHICRQFAVEDYRGEPRILNLVFPYSQYHMVINKEEAYLNDGLSHLQDMEYQGSIETFLALMRSEKDPYHGYGEGEYYISGDRMFFFEMSKFFHFGKENLREPDSLPGKIIRGPFGLPREFSFILVSLAFLQIWLGWVFSVNTAGSFLALFILFSAFSIYYFKTDRLTRLEIFLLVYLGVSTVLFFLDSPHYRFYYHIYFLLAIPLFFIGSLYSPIRNILSEYNSVHNNGQEIFTPEIKRKQRRALVLWSEVWFAVIFILYMSMNTSLWKYVSETFLSVISLLFCGVILLNIFAIHGFYDNSDQP
ncbi:hypothetical protein [Spirochaeta isovalerica]|uniref:Uncharacterized protein n=1 Tax=Spirochaeta isovalerica TaxID=150 RepID=A0A841RDQ2_9SPIO|nr:hypothetical protein [Spirochaeta isovalerica]MBB6480502.1 hypothetical protein [Spirochaeta isovalerica]